MENQKPQDNPKKDFTFIDCAPCSESERSRVRTVVRSHAAQRYFRDKEINMGIQHEKHRVNFEPEDFDQYLDTFHQNAPESISESILGPSLDRSLVSPLNSGYTPHHPTADYQGDLYNNTSSEFKQKQKYTMAVPSHSSLSIDNYWAGSLDPFQSYPSNCVSPGTFQECFSYSS